MEINELSNNQIHSKFSADLNRTIIAGTMGVFPEALTFDHDFVYLVDKTLGHIDKVYKISGKDRRIVWNNLNKDKKLGTLVSSYSRQSGKSSHII